MKDLYVVLGLSRGASIEEVKKAYRALTKELHPDKRRGDLEAEERFKEVNEAYEVLGNPQKKQLYDQFGTVPGASGTKEGGFGGFDFSSFGGDGADLSDLFEGFFGVGGNQRRSKKKGGDDLEVTVEVDMREVLSGKVQIVLLRRMKRCEVCKGSGAEEGAHVLPCTECRGTGHVSRTSRSFFGVIQQSHLCTECHGAGKKAERYCRVCGGEGRLSTQGEVHVTIPPGIHSGQTLRVRGEGEAGWRGGTSGDLFVTVHVRSDPQFDRDGDDVRSDASITLLEALLGGEVIVATVQGTVTLKIPEGTQPGQVFRLRGKGFPILGSGRFGDHYVAVAINIPSRLSRAERKLLEEWRDMRHET